MICLYTSRGNICIYYMEADNELMTILLGPPKCLDLVYGQLQLRLILRDFLNKWFKGDNYCRCIARTVLYTCAYV